MRYDRSADPGRDLRARALCACAFLLAWAGAARAETTGRLLLKGLADVEYFDTDDGSLLLSKNGGDPASAGRLNLLAAGDFGSGLQGFAVTRLEGGKAAYSGATEVELDQAFVRYAFGANPAFRLDAGKITIPFGNFSRRYLSNANPLIGHPDSYDVSYPYGVVFSGAVSRLDYRIALIDKPLANRKYLPEGDSAIRPALAVGVTPAIGLRIGAYATAGPYLGRSVQFAVPTGQSWRDFDQEIAGIELAWSRGYFELNGDAAFSRYEVPAQTAKPRGNAWFLEPRYTWTPRLYTALRIERNDYPYIAPLGPSFWIAVNATLSDAEAVVGWRFRSDLLLKASYRRDRWDVDESQRAFFPNGHWFALQLSYDFDVSSWIERPQ